MIEIDGLELGNGEQLYGVDIHPGLRCFFNASGDACYSCDMGYTRYIGKDVKKAIRWHRDIALFLERWMKEFDGNGEG